MHFFYYQIHNKTNPTWNKTLYDQQIAILSLSDLYVHFMYVCKVSSDTCES